MCKGSGHSGSGSGSVDDSDREKMPPQRPKPAIVRRIRGRSSDSSSDERCSSRPVVVRAGRDTRVAESHGKAQDKEGGGDGFESSSSQGSFESFSRPQRVAEGAGGKATARPKKVPRLLLWFWFRRQQRLF
jgi:hypothetical protein